MVGSLVRFLLFTRCEGLLNSFVRCAHSLLNDPSQPVNKNRTNSPTMNMYHKSLLDSFLYILYILILDYWDFYTGENVLGNKPGIEKVRHIQ